ncbi:MAG: type II secretion system protein [Ruminococcus sp.]|nr:type II secretion system protein [Ruminococcus sp.]
MKKMKKGFTLVELVVVMAVMSILLVGVMSMTGPASSIAKRTKLSDSTYSIANNVENYLQRTLEYADNAWIFDSTDSRANDIPTTVRQFKNAYYNHICFGTTDGTNGNTVFARGIIYVMRLDNSTGGIHTTAYTFPNSSRNTITAGADTTAIAELNPAYFVGDNSNYHVRYALGASQLIPVTDGGGNIERNADTDPFYNVESEKNGEIPLSGSAEQAISIIVNDGAEPSGGRFEGPAVLNVAPLSFTNINYRHNTPIRRNILKDGDEGTNNIVFQGDITNTLFTDEPNLLPNITDTANDFFGFLVDPKTNSLINFTGQDSKPVSTSNDIYIVYSFADELQPRR